MEKKHSISFCTVSMNRSHHLKQTLFKNITDNISYGQEHLEFIVLDYNSKDGMSDWIYDNEDLRPFLDSGVLKCYRTDDPLFFDRSHSRNMCMKLANGEIISNIDADNFLGENFAAYVNNVFCENERSFLVASFFKRDAIGKVCLKRADFFEARGYNEEIISYGFEDLELYNRLINKGIKVIHFEEPDFLKVIHHENSERLTNEKFFNDIESVFLSYVSAFETSMMFVLKDGNIDIYHLKNNVAYIELFIPKAPIIEPHQQVLFAKPKDVLKLIGDQIFEFNPVNGETMHVSLNWINENELEIDIPEKQLFHKVQSPQIAQKYILTMSEIENLKYYLATSNGELNVLDEVLVNDINIGGFGQGVTFNILKYSEIR